MVSASYAPLTDVHFEFFTGTLGFEAEPDVDFTPVEVIGVVEAGTTEVTLTVPVFDDVDPKAQQAIEHIMARAKAHGVVAGIHNAGTDAALKRVAKGFQFVTVSSDARLIAAGAQQVLAKLQAGQAKATGGGTY